MFYVVFVERANNKTINLLFDLAESADVQSKIREFRQGEHVNKSEDRAAMHIALRAQPHEEYKVDGKNVVHDVHRVLKQIQDFSEAVRNGKFTGICIYIYNIKLLQACYSQSHFTLSSFASASASAFVSCPFSFYNFFVVKIF